MKLYNNKRTNFGKISFLLLFIFTFATLNVYKMLSDEKKLPAVKVKNLKGETISTDKFNNDGKPFIINFWATWCKPCILELNNISENYSKWQKETGVKIIAINQCNERLHKWV